MRQEGPSDGSWGLIVAFPDASPSFVHGYEAGTIAQRMTGGHEAEIEKLTVHAANEEVIRRLCIAYGWGCEFAPCKDETEQAYETYRVVTLRKAAAAPGKPNPRGLRIVDAGAGP